MGALSLSHLTYCCATITVNFHRLDHPPFPCKGRLLPSRFAGKYQRKHCCDTSVNHAWASHRRLCFPTVQKGYDPNEGSHDNRNTSYRHWHHRIRYGRNLLHSREKGCRPRFGSDLSQNSGHSSPLTDFQHCLPRYRSRPCCRGSEGKISDTHTATSGFRRC